MVRCKTRKKKCARPGPITKNPFFNFLRELRQKGCTTNMIETAKCGADLWKLLTPEEKQKYCKNATAKRSNPKKIKRPKRRGNPCKKPKNKITCAPKKNLTKRRCGTSTGKRKQKKKGKCMKPGPLTNNPYLNYLRYYKQRNCGLSPRETVRRAARNWVRLSPEKKLKYKQQACRVSTSARRKRTKICRSMRTESRSRSRSRSKGRQC